MGSRDVVGSSRLRAPAAEQHDQRRRHRFNRITGNIDQLIALHAGRRKTRITQQLVRTSATFQQSDGRPGQIERGERFVRSAARKQQIA